jgi:hypothetical protein
MILGKIQCSLRVGGPRSHQRFVAVHGLRVAIRQQAIRAPFSTHAALLPSSQKGLWQRDGVVVDGHHSGLNPLPQCHRSIDVAGPDAGAEAGVGIVDPANDFVFVFPGQEGNDRGWLLSARAGNALRGVRYTYRRPLP